MASVDTTLQPHPTGAAARFAARHAQDHPLKLYGGWFCPFVQRAWIVLAEKSIPHQYVEINPYHKSPDFLALNPRGLVPTLAVSPCPVDGKARKPLYESSVIVEYLDEAYGEEREYGPRLLPRDVYERARARLWMDHVASRVVPGFYRLLQCADPQKMEEVRGQFLESLRGLVREMADPEEGPWFLGGRFGLVDVMLAPWAKRLFLIEHYKEGGVGIPNRGERVGDEEKIWGRWDLWMEAVEGRKSVSETWSDEEEYVKAYRRYADNTTQSEVGRATREGKRLP